MRSNYEQAWKLVQPLVKAIAQWESINGAAIALQPYEYSSLIKVIERANLTSSCRAAMSAAGEDIYDNS